MGISLIRRRSRRLIGIGIIGDGTDTMIVSGIGQIHIGGGE